jgi:general secretion pathway protein D
MVVSDYSYIDIGINLNVTPHINPDNDVTLDLDFKISSILSYVSLPNGTSTMSVPEIGNREVKTVLSVKSDHTLVIGGIISQNHSESHSGPPGASDMPWLGWLFGQDSEDRSQTELIILISPVVVDESTAEDKITASEQRKISVTGEDFKDFKKYFEDKDPQESAPKAPASEPAKDSKDAVDPKDAPKPAADAQAKDGADGAKSPQDSGQKDAPAKKSEPSFFENIFN